MSLPVQSPRAQDGAHDFDLSETDERELDLIFSSGTLFHAGERPAPGLYRQVEGRRIVEIEEGDALPPSFDGHVACYRRVQGLWGQIETKDTPRVA